MKSTGSNLQPIPLILCRSQIHDVREKDEGDQWIAITNYRFLCLFSANSQQCLRKDIFERLRCKQMPPKTLFPHSERRDLLHTQLPSLSRTPCAGKAVGSRLKFIILAASMSASVIKNTRWKRRSSDDGFVSHQGAAGSSSVPRLSKKRIKWYQKAILSGLVALVFISNGGLTSVSLDTFFASSYHTQSFFWISRI
jgi:hypothetical protein